MNANFFTTESRESHREFFKIILFKLCVTLWFKNGLPACAGNDGEGGCAVLNDWIASRPESRSQ
jgi:hypothetical protein